MRWVIAAAGLCLVGCMHHQVQVHLRQDVRVVDGDTIAISDIRYRLAKIDAWELSKPGGPAAKQYLADALPDTVVFMVLGQDRYYRPLIWVFPQINEDLVLEGHARWWVK